MAGLVNREWAKHGTCHRLVEERSAVVGVTAARRSVWDLFFLGPDTPRLPTRGRPPDWRPALRICAACPVRCVCLDWALSMPEQVGVAGGMTAEQRLEEKGRRGLGVPSVRRLRHAS